MSDEEEQLERVIREVRLVMARAEQLISEGFEPQEAVKIACREDRERT